jgi:hypothetical protein
VPSADRSDERLNGDLKQAIETKVPCRTKDKSRKAATEHRTAIERIRKESNRLSKTRKSPTPHDSILLPDQ